MTSVNRFVPEHERHAALLMGMLMQRVRDVFAQEDWSGLRQSHFRVLAAVVPDGLSVTALAERLGMTKQGCGQLVTTLVDSGHLRADPDPADGRLRVVRRTPRGARTVAEVTERIRRIEDEWAEEVGVARYRAFRAVLDELALRGDGEDAEDAAGRG